MLSKVKSIEEEGTDLKVFWDIEATGLFALSETQDSISFSGDAKLIRDQEEIKRVHAKRERHETDLILNLLALDVDEGSILL